MSSIADAAGTTSFTYNAAGQVSTLDDPLVGAADLSTWGYDSAGRMSTRDDAQADLAWTKTYEANTGRTDTLTIKKDSTSATLATFDLGYDDASNVVSKTSSVFSNPSNGSWTYDYDGANRMIEAVGPNATGASTTWTYGWDGASNRISVQVNTGTPVTTSYNSAGDPTSSSDSTTYTTDGVGNLTKIDRTGTSNDWVYGFDAYSRLTCTRQGSACSGTGTISFVLDALDRALSRTKDSVTTSYTYRGIGEVPAKTVTGSTTLKYANSLAGAPIAQKDGSNTRFFLKDIHGDIVGLVNTLAQDRMTLAYDPWGTRLGASGSESSWFGFQSDPTDPDTGQVDMVTRWYEASIGRFTSRDVLLGEEQNLASLNQFGYATAAPMTFVDPTGMRVAKPSGGGAAQEPDESDDSSLNRGLGLASSGISHAAAAGRAARLVVSNAARAVSGGGELGAIARIPIKWGRVTRVPGGVTRVPGGAFVRGLGWAGTAVSAGITLHNLRSEGYSDPEAVAITAGEVGGSLAGAWAGGTALAVGCVASGVGAIVAPVCGAIGAIGGGILGAILGHKAVQSVVDSADGSATGGWDPTRGRGVVWVPNEESSG